MDAHITILNRKKKISSACEINFNCEIWQPPCGTIPFPDLHFSNPKTIFLHNIL